MKIDTIDYMVAGHYLPALINADRSGLSEEEKIELDDFEQAAFETVRDFGGSSPHWSVSVVESGSFKRCEVCGAYADCYPLQLVHRMPEKGV